MISGKLLKSSILVLLTIQLSVLKAQDRFYFFDKDDIAHIKESSHTDWGKRIVDDMKKEITERRQHELRVPLLEGGHIHQYFCPLHNTMFIFDWENPHQHYCTACGKYWEGILQYDWAWINGVHNRNLQYLLSCMYLYIITDDKTYAGYIRDMLLDYASKYPTYIEHNTARQATNKLSGRLFSQSLDESVWASDAARAYIVAKPVMSPDEVRKIEKGYLQVCADMLLQRKAVGNWQVWHNSGLIALGVALQNDEIIQTGLNEHKYGYHHQMSVNVYDDGWWNEGAPTYHYYPLRAMLLTADAVRCRGIDLFDEKLYNMFASPVRGVYANLVFPSHNDGWYGESLPAQVKLYEVAYQRFKDSLFLDILSRSYLQVERKDREALQNNINLASYDANYSPGSLYFKNMGFAVLRSAEKTVILKYGPHGGGHAHPDKLSISIHNGKDELLSDLGTSAYGVPDYTQWYRKTLSHSTVTVDFKDQKATTGKLVNFEAAKKGVNAEATTTDAYPGVEMSRKLFLQGEKLTDTFTCTSGEEHTYDYVLILTQKPRLPETGKAVEFNESGAYQRITNVEMRKGHKSFTCHTDGAEIRIRSLSSDNFEIFTGEAPGIPPANPAFNGRATGINLCYPLIIRTKYNNMKIETTWKIK